MSLILSELIEHGLTKNLAKIEIFGAAENNLKRLSCKFPKGELSVVTGPSGSGKTSLIFRVLYKEAQRRFQEPIDLLFGNNSSLIVPTKVDLITGLSWAIGILERPKNRRPQINVASALGISNNLANIWSGIGERHCEKCDLKITADPIDKIVQQISSLDTSLFFVGFRWLGKYEDLTDFALKLGITRAVVSEEIIEVSAIDERCESSVILILDAIRSNTKDRLGRIENAVYAGLEEGNGELIVVLTDGGKFTEQVFNHRMVCSSCGTQQIFLTAANLLSENRLGACPTCRGIGEIRQNSFEVPDSYFLKLCPACNGSRVIRESQILSIGGNRYSDLLNGNISNLANWCKLTESSSEKVSTTKSTKLEKPTDIFARQLQEIHRLAASAINLGLGYLPLSRGANTLSSGEWQKISLMRSIITPLGSLIYLFDEPSGGLNTYDQIKVLHYLRELVTAGSTVIVVDHSSLLMKEADYVVVLGPKGGVEGGELVASGKPEKVSKVVEIKFENDREILLAAAQECSYSGIVKLKGLNKRNLKNLTLQIRLGLLTGVFGVSGSGKSTAFFQSIVPALQHQFKQKRGLTNTKLVFSTEEKEVFGFDSIEIDGTLSGVIAASNLREYRHSKSSVGSASGVLSRLRPFWAQLTESRVLGLTAKSFSQFHPNGWCFVCKGYGADEGTDCRNCEGSGLRPDILSITFKSVSIAKMFQLTVDELLPIFNNNRMVRQPLYQLQRLGLGYLRLGQRTSSLSRGEQQRLRLRPFLVMRNKPMLFIFDEPCRGLSKIEIASFISLLRDLIASRHSVVVLEHNLQFLEMTDYLIEFGPGSGDEGGTIVREGFCVREKNKNYAN